MTDASSLDTTDLQQASSVSRDLATTLGSLDGLSKSFGQSMTAAFKGAAIQGRSFDQVLRSIAERLSSRALDAALAPLSNAIAGGASSLLSSIGSAFGFARGGVFAGGRVTPFADGGIVSAPTYFPMRSGTGLMGEAGPEAVMPLTRGSDGRLGVASAAAASNLSVTFNVTSPDAASFRRSEAQVTSMLARAVGRGRRGL